MSKSVKVFSKTTEVLSDTSVDVTVLRCKSALLRDLREDKAVALGDYIIDTYTDQRGKLMVQVEVLGEYV